MNHITNFILASILFFSLSSCNNGSTVTITDPEKVSVDSTKLNSSKYDFTPDSLISSAFKSKTTMQVLIKGTVTRILADDTNGDKHQQFILTLASGQTLKVAHNIDLAPRVPDLTIGTVLFIFGQYEWNSEGGVIHWTHTDPNGDHIPGWIECNDIKYGEFDTSSNRLSLKNITEVDIQIDFMGKSYSIPAGQNLLVENIPTSNYLYSLIASKMEASITDFSIDMSDCPSLDFKSTPGLIVLIFTSEEVETQVQHTYKLIVEQQ